MQTRPLGALSCRAGVEIWNILVGLGPKHFILVFFKSFQDESHVPPGLKTTVVGFGKRRRNKKNQRKEKE